MAAKYFAILTNLGAAKLANATVLGTQLEITHMAVGDGGGGLPTPNPAQTALIGERRRAAINLLTIDPLNNSQIISEQVIPEDVGGWWIREVGLFDKDGALVAIANCPETYKPQLQEGSGRTQTIRVILIVSSTQSVSLKIDPSVVLATRKYVDDNVIEVRAYADKLITEHIAHEDAHPQYAEKANVPVSLDNLQKIAAAMNNDPSFSATIFALVGDKLAKDQNGADILDIKKFIKNLHLSGGLSSSTVGRLVGLKVFTSSGTYTPEESFSIQIVEAVGGGAGGGGSSTPGISQISAAAGGGAGSYGKSIFSVSNSIDVIIGAGGHGGLPSQSSAGAMKGGAGGDTKFGELMICPGGAEGLASNSFTGSAFCQSATSNGKPCIGANIYQVVGEAGGQGISLGNSALSGRGGNSKFGTGGGSNSMSSLSQGIDALGYGAGGGGALSGPNSAGARGGDGANGLVVVWEYA